ncbi:MAG: acyl-CoA thioesterase [Polyangiaceae bacterium]|nr:acyl-CoA thioesterase [Polyangiaceae bacterium]
MSPSGPELELFVARTVPFYDLDPMGVVWHGNYLKYIDEARMALFDRTGLDLYRLVSADGYYAFPIVKSTIKHVAPLRLRDRLEVYARVLDARLKITMDFEVRRGQDGVVCARAQSEQAAVRLPELALEYRIPAAITQVLCPWQTD